VGVRLSDGLELNNLNCTGKFETERLRE